MRVAIYDRVEPPVPAELPLRLTQTCSQRAATAFLVLVIPAALGGTLAALAITSRRYWCRPPAPLSSSTRHLASRLSPPSVFSCTSSRCRPSASSIASPRRAP